MKMKYQVAWSLAAAALLAGGAANAACTLAPEHSIVNQGQSVELNLTCDAAVAKVEWKQGSQSLTGELEIDPAASSLRYTVPGTLAVGSYTYTATVPVTGGSASHSATVVVQSGSSGGGGGGGTTYYTVSTAGSGAGGSISPTSAQVAHGETHQFSVVANSGYTATASGCDGSLFNQTFTTGAITGNCTVTATFTQSGGSGGGGGGSSGGNDPGIGSGLWLPTGNANLVVADHSGGATHPPVTYLPGCLNGQNSPNYYSGCAGSAVYSGSAGGTPVQVVMDLNRVVSVRLAPKAGAGQQLRWIKLDGADGSSNLGRSMSMWLTTDPTTSYESTPAACKITASSNVLVITGGSYCPISTSNSIYYLNIRSNAACTNCRYKINVSGSDLQ